MRTYGTYRNIRDLSWDCLLKHNIHSLPIDILKIANGEDNVRVIKNSSVDILTEKEDARSYFDGTVWYIIYDDTKPTEEKRYAVAHELGHYFLNHELKYVKYSHTQEIRSTPAAEKQADMFAIRLLCPSCVLWKAGVYAPSDIAFYCKVPLEVAFERSERMKELRKRNAFLKSPLEQKVHHLFLPYINEIAPQKDKNE